MENSPKGGVPRKGTVLGSGPATDSLGDLGKSFPLWASITVPGPVILAVPVPQPPQPARVLGPGHPGPPMLTAPQQGNGNRRGKANTGACSWQQTWPVMNTGLRPGSGPPAATATHS